jgi:hypothetical protein
MVAFQGVYDSLAEFMATLDPIKVIGFHAPTKIQNRVEELLDKKQDTELSLTEQEELNHYLILEHIVRLAKSRARLYLVQSKS